MLGPVLERLHNEMLSPKIDLTFQRIMDAGLLPPPPKELQDSELKVEFVSTLAQAQKMVGLGSMDRLLGTVGNLAAGSGDPSGMGQDRQGSSRRSLRGDAGRRAEYHRS